MKESLKHHVFLSPSVTASDGDTEGGAPVTIIEMAASGIPIVSTTHCDIPEVIEDGVGGMLSPERNPAALAESIAKLVAAPERWPAMLRSARRRIEEHFDARIQGERLARRYESCL
jgi:colanic acid/amylovoran biosynthesis glycosyltransferase